MFQVEELIAGESTEPQVYSNLTDWIAEPSNRQRLEEARNRLAESQATQADLVLIDDVVFALTMAS